MSDTQCVDTPGLRLEFGLVPWDMAACGFPVAQITRFECGQSFGADEENAWKRFTSWRDANGVGLITCRLPMERLREIHFLEERAFRFIELVMQPEALLSRTPGVEDPKLVIMEAEDADVAHIGLIASSAFSTDRFSVDARLPAGAAGERYRRWVESIPGHPTQRLLKVEEEGLLVGFFVVEDQFDGTCYWHLTAVDPALHGLGYGKRIWNAMLSRLRNAGVVRVRTTISMRNIPVVNLYAGLGFRFKSPKATLHWVLV